MNFYFVKTPRFIKFIFRNWVWGFSKNRKAIYLTFDDGPTPEITEWVLNLLKQHEAKATFFCIGKNVSQNPTIFQQIIRDGNAVGIHTNDHLNGWEATSKNYLKNIQDSERNFTKNLKIPADSSQFTNLFRPPYGKLTFEQSKKIRQKGYKIVMWDVLSGDFDFAISKEKCLKNVIENTKNGSIIVFHDSVKAHDKLKYVLPKVLKYYSEKGYDFNKIHY